MASVALRRCDRRLGARRRRRATRAWSHDAARCRRARPLCLRPRSANHLAVGVLCKCAHWLGIAAQQFLAGRTGVGGLAPAWGASRASVPIIRGDIWYVQQSRDEMEVLFTFLAERYERRSVIITSNLLFSEWDRIFKDPMTTAAAIGRLAHHSAIIEMTGPSVRADEAEQARKETATTTRSPHRRHGTRSSTPSSAEPQRRTVRFATTSWPRVPRPAWRPTLSALRLS